MMNLVEADSRNYLMERYHRRVEQYRIRHKQNYSQYQNVWREDVRKQLEETTQLHKRWIEFQAKRTVGKAKNDTMSASGLSVIKKPKKKLPASPENTATTGQAGTSNAYNSSANNDNIINKSLPNISANQNLIGKSFNNQNAYQGFAHPSSLTPASNRSAFNTNLGSNLFQVTVNNNEACAFFDTSKSIDGKEPYIDMEEIFSENRNPDENSSRVDGTADREQAFDNQVIDDICQLWITINKEGDMPKEFLETLEKNETCDQSNITYNSFPSNFSPIICLPDDVNLTATPLGNVSPDSTSMPAMKSLIPNSIKSSPGNSLTQCNVKDSSFDQSMTNSGFHQELTHNSNHINTVPSNVIGSSGGSFLDQSVIRNNPAVYITNQPCNSSVDNSFNTNISKVATNGVFNYNNVENNSNFNRPPPYYDATSSTFMPSLHQPNVFNSSLPHQDNTYNNRTQFFNESQAQNSLRQCYNPQQQQQQQQLQQQFCPSTIPRGNSFRRQINFSNPGFMSYSQQNLHLNDGGGMCYQVPQSMSNQKFQLDNNLYQNNFNSMQGYPNNVKFNASDFNNQPYHKVNTASHDMFQPQCSFGTPQQSFQSTQQHGDDNMTGGQVGFQNMGRNNYYWNHQNGHLNVPYHKQNQMIGDPSIANNNNMNFQNVSSCSYSTQNLHQLLPQHTLNISMQQSPPNDYMTNNINDNQINHMSAFSISNNQSIIGDVVGSTGGRSHQTSVSNSLDISTDDTLKMLSDIIKET